MHFGRYSLEDSFNGKFSIHPTSGELYVSKKLDREEKNTYQLKVIARDNSFIPKQAIADVTVIVDDQNDNTPQFEKQSYQQTVNNPTLTGKLSTFSPSPSPFFICLYCIKLTKKSYQITPVFLDRIYFRGPQKSDIVIVNAHDP